MKMMKKRIAVLAILATTPILAQAEWFSFDAITANDSTGVSQTVGTTQFWMEIVETGVGRVSATITNTGPANSKISEVYFDTPDPDANPAFDLKLLGINNGTGVRFNEGATPQNLPGGSNLLPAFQADLSAGSSGNKNTIDPHEWLLMEMAYNDTYDFLDMLTNAQLRVGLHARSLDAGGQYSESFVNNPRPHILTEHGFIPIPEPGAVTLTTAAAAGFLFIRRRLID